MKKLKVYSAIIVSTPCPFFRYSLESIKGQVDGVVIIVTKPFNSNKENIQSVLDIITKFKMGFNGNVIVVTTNVKTLHEARQLYLDNMPDDVDFIFQVDSEELI